MIWDDSLDCKLCISAKGAFCAHLEVVDPTANRTKVDWRAVFDTADGNAVLGRLEDAKSARPRFVAVEARGFVGEPGRPALESYLNVSDKGGELLRADFVADGAASGKRASGLTSLTVRVDAKEELDATVSGALDWSGTEEANQTDLQASMTVINKDQERLHMAMTADGDSQDEAMAGSLGLLVRTDADDKLDGHLSGTVDWSGMTDANQTDLWASMTVSNKQRERLHMAMTADGDSQDEAMAGSMGLLVRVDNEKTMSTALCRAPPTGAARRTRIDGPTGQHDGQQQAARNGLATADGDSQDEAMAGSFGLALRVDADEKFDGLVSGGLDWSDALEARMTVSNEGREKVHMAMTADGNSRFRERDGSLGLLVRVDNENEVDGLVSGSFDWSSRRTRIRRTYGPA